MYYKTNTLQSYGIFFIHAIVKRKKMRFVTKRMLGLGRQDKFGCSRELVVEIFSETADERGA